MSVLQQGVTWSEVKRHQRLHTGKEWTWGEGINVCVGLFFYYGDGGEGGVLS